MDRRKIILLGVLSAVSVSVYLLVSQWIHGIGFPLDDAWIHQTYARNLAQAGKWTFISGQTSGGSTGPLWGLLLAVFHYFGLAPYFGAYFLGFLILWGTAYLGTRIFQGLLPEGYDHALYVGILLVFEWHLVWSAGSGMETLLFSALVLWISAILISGKERWFLLGLLTGLSIWVRPGGVTLLGPIFFVLAFRFEIPDAFFAVGKVILGLALITGPYLLFNHVVAGDMLPNTFYAKQAEYAAARGLPFIRRVVDLAIHPFVGIGVVLLPGLWITIKRSIAKGDWENAAPILWAAGYILLYAWRLPLSYQHGRYIMPAMAPLYIWGFVGFWGWVHQKKGTRARWVLERVWAGVLVLTALIFWGIGARAYGMDVAVIETEMVRMAKWVQNHAGEDEVIAAHDIGALGYFTDQKIVDLAGLVSPDVIPFIRDEGELAVYLDQNDVDYLITFPFWYPELVNQAPLIYRTGGEFAPKMGVENMAVYRWKP